MEGEDARGEKEKKLLTKGCIIVWFPLSGQAPSPDQTEEDLKSQEQNILQLGERYREEGKAKEMSNLIKQVRPFLKLISKAKAAKLVRGLVDMFLDMEREGKKGQAEVQLCKVRNSLGCFFFLATFPSPANKTPPRFGFQDCIQWAKEEKRTFLRQSLESRLIGLYYETEKFTDALSLGSQLLKELKKLDDKNLLVEVTFWRSWQKKKNHPHFYLSLTFALLYCIGATPGEQDVPRPGQPAEGPGRPDLGPDDGQLHLHPAQDPGTAGPAGRHPPRQRGEGLQDGLLLFLRGLRAVRLGGRPARPRRPQVHAHEQDHARPVSTPSTSTKWFHQVFFSYKFLPSLFKKKRPEDVLSLVSGKLALKYSGTQIDAMKAISQAAKKRSLADFQKVG